MSEEVLARFHGALVEALRQRHPGELQRPFTVAEIYHDLVPYRAYRDVLGVEMNGDYEHALLRLLAGEGDYLEMESEHAVQEIQEELASVNPNTGLYRAFAAVDVRLNPSRVEHAAEPAPAMTPSPAPGAGDSWPEEAGTAEPARQSDPPVVENAEPETREDPMPQSSTPPGVCPWCREGLPRRGNLTFCPFCGTDVRLVPCPSCGETLEPDWRFCIACGAAASED